MDEVRRQTDKRLKAMESKMGGIYENSPALKRIKTELALYMKTVQKRTESSYKAYIEETDKDIKEERKRAYTAEIEALTIKSAKYNKLVNIHSQRMKFLIIIVVVNHFDFLFFKKI